MPPPLAAVVYTQCVQRHLDGLRVVFGHLSWHSQTHSRTITCFMWCVTNLKPNNGGWLVNGNLGWRIGEEPPHGVVTEVTA